MLFKRERHRERETDRGRQTDVDRHRDRETDRDKETRDDRQTQTDRRTERRRWVMGERKAGKKKKERCTQKEKMHLPRWFPFTEKHAVIPIARGFESYDCMTSARFLAATNDLGLPPLIFALSTSGGRKMQVEKRARRLP